MTVHHDRYERVKRKERKSLRTEDQVRRLFGRVASALGVAAAFAGGLTPDETGPAAPIGLLLGALGYLLGARLLGTLAVLLSVIELVVGVLIR